MSTSRQTYLSCDGPSCDELIDGGLRLNATDCRREARSEGWKVSLLGGRDLCPNCATKG